MAWVRLLRADDISVADDPVLLQVGKECRNIVEYLLLILADTEALLLTSFSLAMHFEFKVAVDEHGSAERHL
jgi:hypothetical protein